MSDYLKELNSGQLPKVIEDMRNDAKKENVPTVRNATLNMLVTLIIAKQPKKILEIGTAYGCSGAAMLFFSKDAELTTIEKNDECVEKAKENFKKAGVYDRVNLFTGDANEIVPMLGGKYDFVFLDGPKGQYVKFYPYLFDLLAVGGTLVCDNVLYKGLVEHVPEDNRHKHITVARNMREFLDELLADERMATTLSRVGDGVTVSVKK